MARKPLPPPCVAKQHAKLKTLHQGVPVRNSKSFAIARKLLVCDFKVGVGVGPKPTKRGWQVCAVGTAPSPLIPTKITTLKGVVFLFNFPHLIQNFVLSNAFAFAGWNHP